MPLEFLDLFRYRKSEIPTAQAMTEALTPFEASERTLEWPHRASDPGHAINPDPPRRIRHVGPPEGNFILCLLHGHKRHRQVCRILAHPATPLTGGP